MTTTEVLKELESLGNPKTKELLMRNHGVREPFYGVKIGDMKPLQKKIKRDYQLALDLYKSGVYDAMYLAGLIADDAKMTRADLELWASEAYGGCLPETTVPTVAAGSPKGWELALEWIDHGEPRMMSIGWATLSCIVALRSDADLDIDKLSDLVERVQSSIHQAPNETRYSMNNFIISVAAYVTPLTEKARIAAESIGKVEADLGPNACKIPYAPEYIEKIEKRGAIGKKRKTVKC